MEPISAIATASAIKAGIDSPAMRESLAAAGRVRSYAFTALLWVGVGLLALIVIRLIISWTDPDERDDLFIWWLPITWFDDAKRRRTGVRLRKDIRAKRG